MPSRRSARTASHDSYRPLRKIDIVAFGHDILRSRLYDTTVADADEYAELFDSEVKHVLDIHALLRTGRRRCGQHDIRQLSDEARQAKQLRRRLESRYRRTSLESDRRTFICPLVQPHATASRSQEPTTSSRN